MTGTDQPPKTSPSAEPPVRPAGAATTTTDIELPDKPLHDSNENTSATAGSLTEASPDDDHAPVQSWIGQNAPRSHLQRKESSDSVALIDAERWFERSNRNPTATFDPNAMDASPYVLRKDDMASYGDGDGDGDSSEKQNTALVQNPYQLGPPTSFMPGHEDGPDAPSSGAEEYRSVIDDLTVENKRLKEELKRYRHLSSHSSLDKDRLFEVKVHGLGRRKKQELEATLRGFVDSLGSPSAGSSSQRKRDKSSSPKQSRTGAQNSYEQSTLTSNGSRSKHASNSSSWSRPVDSAYASMSAGANSSGTSLIRPSIKSQRAHTSEQKVEHYLQDIPEGLHPNYGLSVLGEKDKKTLIVRRLEQIFTGKIGGRFTRRNRPMLPPSVQDPSSAADTPAAGGSGSNSVPIDPSSSSQQPSANLNKPMREARIRPQKTPRKKAGSRDKMSTSNSNSNGDDTGTGTGTGDGTGNDNGTGNGLSSGNGNGNGHGNGSGSGNGNDHSHGHSHGHSNGHRKSPTEKVVVGQLPTRPRDLDPDRVQVPAENMEYIRHLGLVPPKIGDETVASLVDVAPDAEGWVYLNLLANLAQLHIFNVAPDFIRRAIVEKSSKFQLSPDGQKVRWRGGTEGTKFSSDGSGGDSQQSPSTDEGDGSDENGQRKRVRTSVNSRGGAAGIRKPPSAYAQDSAALSGFHYKPLFVRQKSHSSHEGRFESESRGYGIINRSANGESSSDSGDASYKDGRGSSLTHSQRKKRQHNGVLVYYTGAPFCTDLAGESGGEASPDTCMTSSGQQQDSMDSSNVPSTEQYDWRPSQQRSMSGSYQDYHPLTDNSPISDDQSSGVGQSLVPPEAMEIDSAETTSSPRSSSIQSFDESLTDGPWSGEDDSEGSPVARTPEPILEASGVSRVFPEDHFHINVTTSRPFKTPGPSAGKNADSGKSADDVVKAGPSTDAIADNGDNSGNRVGSPGVFSMTSLQQRLDQPTEEPVSVFYLLEQQRKGSTKTDVTIGYVSMEVKKHEPAPLPPAASLYPAFSSDSSVSNDCESLESDEEDDEDKSMLASSSSEISLRANPHHSDNHPSPMSPVVSSPGDYGADEEETGLTNDSTED